MYKHVFIGVIKEGVDDAKINERIEMMRAIKEEVPQVIGFAVGRNLGWLMPKDAIILTFNFNSREDLQAFIDCDAHQKVGAVAGEVFDMEASMAFQIKLN